MPLKEPKCIEIQRAIMRILHIGNVAGIPQELAKEQRKLGYKSEVTSFQNHPFNYSNEHCYPVNSKFPYNYIERFIIFLKIFYKYDIYHFHGGTILPKGVDSIIWKLLEKRLIIHHHGSELRYKKEEYMYSKCADKIIVSTPDLLEWSPHAIWLPNPIDTQRYLFVKSHLQAHKLRILHAPSNQSVKGTEYVIQAINKLEQDGYDIDFILLENISHDEVLKQIELSDIIVDQLILGWYGVFSIEAMCIGKPVLCYIKPDLLVSFQDLPILNTTPESVYTNLIKLIESPELRIKLGIQGRKYVEKTHDSRMITKKLIDLYTK